jgi:apolipoprotein N-acyltransferase
LKKIHKIGLSVLSGVLAGVSWPSTGGLVPLIFIAFVPLLIVAQSQLESSQSGEKSRVIWYAYIAFLVWNIISTWWVWNASSFGAVVAILFNALFVAVIFSLFQATRKTLGDLPGFAGLIMYWLAWEWFHMDWDLSWPWLTLGNVFAELPNWVQWYEFTGVNGGTLWIWIVNIVVFRAVQKYLAFSTVRASIRPLVTTILIISVPIIAGYSIFNSYEQQGKEVEVVVVQPNVDPYNDKFGGLSSEEQVERITDLARQKVTGKTRYVVAPETAIPKSFDEAEFKQTNEYAVLKELQNDFPKTNIVIGASTFVIYGRMKPDSPTARYAERNQIYYDYCNTAVHISAKDSIEFYHKSKLVPGVEMMPFPWLFQHFQDLAFNLGGTTGSLGRQDYRESFSSEVGSVAPVICYESVYGEYVGDYIHEGAEAIFIITNDGWWGNTPGYHQHLKYAQLRAIEHRKSIARSANTGISAFINQKGEIEQHTSWWEPDVIKANIALNPQKTFYTKHGDYMSRTSLAFSGLLLLLVFVRRRQSESKKQDK